MSSFTKPLRVEFLDQERKGRIEALLTEGFRYYVGDLKSDEWIDVPAGYVTDFASTPRMTWVIFPPLGRYAKAAVLHDYLYSNHIYTRRKADKIFLEAMKVLKVPKWKRCAMYLAVRAGGAKGYRKDGKANS